jgi:hypothetical protein
MLQRISVSVAVFASAFFVGSIQAQVASKKRAAANRSAVVTAASVKSIAIVPRDFDMGLDPSAAMSPPQVERTAEKKSSDSGNSKVSGEAATVSATSSGGFGGGFQIPNVQIGLKIDGAASLRKGNLIAASPEYRLVDGTGKTIDQTFGPGVYFRVPKLEVEPGGADAFLYIHMPPSEKEARIASLDGTILITPAQITETKFRGTELSKRSTRGTTTLENVKKTTDALEVTIGLTIPMNFSAMMTNPAEMMRRSMGQSVEVTLIDSAGKVHQPALPASKTETTNGVTTFTTTGSSSGSGSGSSFKFGSSGSAPDFKRTPGGMPSGGMSSNGMTSNRTVRFAPLPSGVTLSAVVCRVTSRTGESRRIPFRLENLTPSAPAPGGR